MHWLSFFLGFWPTLVTSIPFGVSAMVQCIVIYERVVSYVAKKYPKNVLMGQSWAGILGQVIEAMFSFTFGKILNNNTRENSMIVCMVIQGLIAIGLISVLIVRVWSKED